MLHRLLLLVVLLAAGHPLRAAEPAAAFTDLPPTAILRTMPSETPPNHQLPGLTFVAGYEIIGQPVPIPAAEAARLTAALRAPAAFPGSGSEEKMRPGVAYRFGEGAAAVHLLVCFSCDKVLVFPASSDALPETRHLAQATREALLEVAKTLLPSDEAIQELPRVRSKHPVPPPAAPTPAE